eukprot:5374109-Alexandrium_andersonii.AAC.1
MGPWSRRWFSRASAWHDHIQRAHAPEAWPSIFIKFRTAEELDARKALQHHRLRARVRPGRPCARWEEAVAWARDHDL